MSIPETAERRFARAFDDCGTRVLAYALRHTDPHTAQDVVADVFLVAWRRIDDLPDDPLPWLLVVARHTMSNGRRSVARRGRLGQRLEALAATAAGDSASASAEELAVDRSVMLAALAALTEAEREAVLLVAWDGLTPTDAAHVAGCSRNAFDARLLRARRRLERGCAADPSPSPSVPPSPSREARA